jgi:cell division protein FtsI/penicillin-binding protein 2
VPAAPAGAANWNEVSNFERADPARSPLRLPAFQHDGGANSSPGSTFKVISAMGLEQAALRDPQVEALLAGLPLPAINRMARDKGFAFRTDSASYPAATRLAHITNYRDQHLDRRARDGRLGLSEALTYSLNTWFAWTAELSDRSLFGRADGGVAGLHGLEAGAVAGVRPIADMAQRLGFERALRLDGGLLPADYAWSRWDARCRPALRTSTRSIPATNCARCRSACACMVHAAADGAGGRRSRAGQVIAPRPAARARRLPGRAASRWRRLAFGWTGSGPG